MNFKLRSFFPLIEQEKEKIPRCTIFFIKYFHIMDKERFTTCEHKKKTGKITIFSFFDWKLMKIEKKQIIRNWDVLWKAKTFKSESYYYYFFAIFKKVPQE